MNTTEDTQTETNGAPARVRKPREPKPQSAADRFEALREELRQELEAHENEAKRHLAEAARILTLLGENSADRAFVVPPAAAKAPPRRPRVAKATTTRPASADAPVGKLGPRGPRAQALPARVLAYLETKPEGASLASISTFTEAASGHCNAALAGLMKRGSVTRTGERGGFVYSAVVDKTGAKEGGAE